MSKRTDTIKSLFTAPQSNTLSADNMPGALPRVSSGSVRSLKDSFSGVEKENEELAWVYVASVCERISCNHALHFGGRAHDDGGTNTESALDRHFNPHDQSGKISLFGLENHVTALHIGLRVSQFHRFV